MVPVFTKAGGTADGASICCIPPALAITGTTVPMDGASICCSKAGGTEDGASIY